jgi:hypothetical protein
LFMARSVDPSVIRSRALDPMAASAWRRPLSFCAPRRQKIFAPDMKPTQNLSGGYYLREYVDKANETPRWRWEWFE